MTQMTSYVYPNSIIDFTNYHGRIKMGCNTHCFQIDQANIIKVLKVLIISINNIFFGILNYMVTFFLKKYVLCKLCGVESYRFLGSGLIETIFQVLKFDLNSH